MVCRVDPALCTVLSEIELVVVHRPRAAFDELKHPEFFEVFGDAAGARAAVSALDAEMASVSHPPAAGSAAPASVATGGEASGAEVPRAGQKRRRGAGGAADSDAKADEPEPEPLADEDSDSGVEIVEPKVRRS